MTEVDNLSEYVIAPQHSMDLAVLDPHVIEGVAYSPNKCCYLINYPDDAVVYCKTCDWESSVSKLPYESGAVQPDMCPDCAKDGQIGHVRSKTNVKEGIEQ